MGITFAEPAQAPTASAAPSITMATPILSARSVRAPSHPLVPVTGPPVAASIVSRRVAPAAQVPVVPAGFVKNLPALALDLLQARVVICSPIWGMRPPKGSTITAYGKIVTGKHSAGMLFFDVHEKFEQLAANSKRLEACRDRYTILDPSDGFRQMSASVREQAVNDLLAIYEDRKVLARWFDDNWVTVIEPLIEAEHPNHWDWIKPRIEKHLHPPFGPRMAVKIHIRERIAATFNASKLSGQGKLWVEQQAEEFAREQVSALINGAMLPIVELAREINGEAPNPSFDPAKDEGPGNRKFLGGINSGSKKGGFIDNVMVQLDRVANFRQFMSPEVLAQAEAAKAAVARAGGEETKINADGAIQTAIRNEMLRLSAAMNDNIKATETAARRERGLAI